MVIEPGTKVTLCGEECTVVSLDNSNEFVLATLTGGSMCSVPRRWVERALSIAMGYPDFHIANAISTGQMVVSETADDALMGMILNGYAVFPNRVPIDPDADLYAVYSPSAPDAVVTDDPEADEPYVIGNAD